MKNLTQLIQEQKDRFVDIFCNPNELDSRSPLHPDYQNGGIGRLLNDIELWHTSSLTDIIRNEIERKKLLIDKDEFIYSCNAEYTEGYNTAITEDIQYWQNVLEELEKNI